MIWLSALSRSPWCALHLETGKVAWQKRTDQPMIGGSLATAAGLVFTGEGNGNCSADDARSGKLLWQFSAGAECNAAPMSFEFQGEQMIGMACGGTCQLGYPLGDAIVVFGLPEYRF